MTGVIKQTQRLEDARRLMSDAFVWDMTLPWGTHMADEDETLPRFHAAGVDAISLTIANAKGDLAETIRWIAALNRHIRSRSDTLTCCRTVDELDRAKADGKLGLVYHFQETLHFERKIELIELFYDLGIRHSLLAYNVKNFVGDGCAERTDAGLSRWGIEVVQEMNRVGMLVCGTHSGYRTTMDAMDATSAPFIFSHSNAYSVYPHYRNIRDDQIKACAKTGGVIGVNGLGEFLDDHEAASTTIFKHIDHIAQLVGPKHVGIGLDFVKKTDAFWASVATNSYMWPANKDQKRTHSKFAQPEQIVEIVGLLLLAGYTEQDIRGILGGNFRRAAKQVWK